MKTSRRARWFATGNFRHCRSKGRPLFRKGSDFKPLGRRLAFESLEERRLLATFQGLGDLSGGIFSSQANAVSADGSVVVGQSRSSGNWEAFRWDETTGMQGLGYLPNPVNAPFSYAYGISADGSVIVGQSYADGPAGSSTRDIYYFSAFRWTQTGGMQNLGHLGFRYSPPEIVGGANDLLAYESRAGAVSADGITVVGISSSDGRVAPDPFDFGAGDRGDPGGIEAFVWNGSMQSLGIGIPSGATGISADGAVIVGGAGGEAFRWSNTSGLLYLDDLPGGIFQSGASAVSEHGLIVVGRGSSENGTEAFRWTETSGMQGLGDLPGGTFASVANAVSADGSVVVGWSSSENGGEAFRWTKSGGMESIRDILVSYGADMTGWTLASATGVSADGRVIVGYGTNPNGDTEAWRAVLDPPVVVNVATHGWDPLGTANADWSSYATVLNSMPLPGSALDGKIATYVSNWDSNTGFTPAFLQLAASKVEDALENPIAASLLKASAEITSRISNKKAHDAATTIVKELQQQYLLSPSESNELQKVQLIGHSRGAAVNALVSTELAKKGYENIVTYVSLDGFSTDWPGDADVITDISIVENATVGEGGKKLNYRVEQGLAEWIGSGADASIEWVLDWLAEQIGVETVSVDDIPRFSSLLVDAFGDVRAPIREDYGFADEVIVGQGMDSPSTHVNISPLYFNGAPLYRNNSYVGEHADDPPSGSTETGGSEPVGQAHDIEGGGAGSSADGIGFSDGSFDELGELWTQAVAAGATPTGDLLIDYLLESIVDPAALLALIWEVTGDAELVNVD